jgi:glycosyltransferase involved in cell wall biosynthesis
MSPDQGGRLRYAIVTPVRNDAEGLRRLARSVANQRAEPAEWLVIVQRSDDATLTVAMQLAQTLSFLRVVEAPASVGFGREGSVGELLEVGFRTLRSGAELVVKADSDVSFSRRHIGRLIRVFEEDPRLGIASGVRFERYERGWYTHRPSSFHVEAQCRAYRRACLDDILPFERCLGWETADVVRARLTGWQTRVVSSNVFAHHRPIGGWDNRRGAFFAEGIAAYFLGYRFYYLVLRTAFRIRREPVAASQVAGYLCAFARRAKQIDDVSVTAYLRRDQQLRRLPGRVRASFSGARWC